MVIDLLFLSLSSLFFFFFFVLSFVPLLASCSFFLILVPFNRGPPVKFNRDVPNQMVVHRMFGEWLEDKKNKGSGTGTVSSLKAVAANGVGINSLETDADLLDDEAYNAALAGQKRSAPEDDYSTVRSKRRGMFKEEPVHDRNVFLNNEPKDERERDTEMSDAGPTRPVRPRGPPPVKLPKEVKTGADPRSVLEKLLDQPVMNLTFREVLGLSPAVLHNAFFTKIPPPKEVKFEERDSAGRRV